MHSKRASGLEPSWPHPYPLQQKQRQSVLQAAPPGSPRPVNQSPPGDRPAPGPASPALSRPDDILSPSRIGSIMPGTGCREVIDLCATCRALKPDVARGLWQTWWTSSGWCNIRGRST